MTEDWHDKLRELEVYYILEDDHTITKTTDLRKAYMQTNRVVDKTKVGDAEVSTVFLIHNHNYMGGEPPLLFETMIFGGEKDGAQWRCCTWSEALEQHQFGVGVALGMVSDD